MGNGNELNNLPWSFGDFLVFLHEVKYRDFQTQLLINSSHIGFMVASKEAYKLLQNPPLLLEIISKKLVGHAHRRGIIESMKYIMGLKKSGNIIGVMRRRIYPPARIFDEIGIITYSARHLGHFGKDLILKQD